MHGKYERGHVIPERLRARPVEGCRSSVGGLDSGTDRRQIS